MAVFLVIAAHCKCIMHYNDDLAGRAVVNKLAFCAANDCHALPVIPAKAEIWCGKKASCKEKNTVVVFFEKYTFNTQQSYSIMKYGGCVYIIANHSHSVLYIGVTSNLLARVTEHKEKIYPDSFTAKYNCNKLLYYESFMRIEEAIYREKQLKKWKREWKEKLIASMNPGWIDLFDSLQSNS